MNIDKVKTGTLKTPIESTKKAKQSFKTKLKDTKDAFVSSKNNKEPNKIKAKILKAAAAISAFALAILAVFKGNKQNDKTVSDETIKVAEAVTGEKNESETEVMGPSSRDFDDNKITEDKKEDLSLAEEIKDKAEDLSEETDEELTDDENSSFAENPEETAATLETGDKQDDVTEQEALSDEDGTTDDRYEDISDILRADAEKYKNESEDKASAPEIDKTQEPDIEPETTVEADESTTNNKAQFVYMGAREHIEEVTNAHNFGMNTQFRDVYYASGTLMRTFDNGNILEYSPSGLLKRRTNIQRDSYSIMTFDNKNHKTDIIDYSKKTGEMTVQKDIRYAHGIGTPQEVYHFDKNGKLIK